MELFDLQTKKMFLERRYGSACVPCSRSEGVPKHLQERRYGSALAALIAAFVAMLIISFLWKKQEIRVHAAVGLLVAWVLSSVSLFVLDSASSSMSAFFKVWLGGIFARVLCLGVLMAFAWTWPASSQAALLLSYCFGVFAFLLIESRDILSKACAQ